MFSHCIGCLFILLIVSLVCWSFWKDTQHHWSSGKCKLKPQRWYYLTSVGVLSSRTQKATGAGMDGIEKASLSHWWWKCKLVQPLWKTIQKLLKKIKNRSSPVQFTQLCPTLCDPMDCSTPGLAVHHQLLEWLKLMSIESVMPSNHLILCWPLLLPPSIIPSIRVFSNDSVLHIRWSKYWSFSFNISPSNEYSGFISFRIDWFGLLAVWGTLKHFLYNTSYLQKWLILIFTSYSSRSNDRT